MRLLALVLLALASSAGAAEKPMPFDEALSRIVERNTQVMSATSQLGAAKARTLPAKFAFLPSLSFDAKEWWGGGSAQPYTTSQAELTSDFGLWRWGADLAGLQAALNDQESREAALDQAWLTAEADGVNTLVIEIQRQREVEIASDIAGLQRKLLDIARQRYASGYLAQQEVDKVAVDLGNANSNLADAQQREMDARAQLVSRLGHANVAAEWPWKERIASAASSGQLKQSEFLLELRPDWRSARAGRDAEEHRADRAWRQLFPAVDAALAYGNYQTLGLSGAGWSAQVTVSLPFFDHMVSYANARAQSYTAEVAGATLEQTARDARADWQTAHEQFDTAIQTAIERERIVETSRRLYQDSLKRFQGGKMTANDLVIDQRRLLDTESFAVQGWSSAHLAYARLCHSLGRRLQECGGPSPLPQKQ